MIGGVATAAAVRTWPCRVYSFPSDLRLLSIDELKRIYVERAMTSLVAEARENMWIPSWSVPTLQNASRVTFKEVVRKEFGPDLFPPTPQGRLFEKECREVFDREREA
jgi:hypothetical protein